MYDFSQQEKHEYQAPDLPDGTFLIGVVHLRPVPFSRDKWPFVAEDVKTGLAKWFFEFSALAPLQHNGIKLQGAKYMDPNQQVARGLGDAPEMMHWALKGCDTIRRIFLCDNRVRGKQAPLSMEDYHDLEGKVCAVQTTVFQGKTCIKFFLDASNAKDAAIIDGLVAQAKQAAQPKQQAAAPAPTPAPAPAQASGWGAQTAQSGWGTPTQDDIPF